MKGEFFKRCFNCSRCKELFLSIIIKVYIRHIAVCLMDKHCTILGKINKLHENKKYTFFSVFKQMYLTFPLQPGSNVNHLFFFVETTETLNRKWIIKNKKFHIPWQVYHHKEWIPQWQQQDVLQPHFVFSSSLQPKLLHFLIYFLWPKKD